MSDKKKKKKKKKKKVTWEQSRHAPEQLQGNLNVATGSRGVADQPEQPEEVMDTRDEDTEGPRPSPGGGNQDGEASDHMYASKVLDDVREDAVYILQRIKVDDNEYNVFYDGGCKRFVSRFNAIQRLGTRATLVKSGPTVICGVGGMTMETPHGIYGVRLPIRGGHEYDALISGTCLDVITESFPSYPLHGRVENDIKVAFVEGGGNIEDLPALEATVGGDTDFMLGITYNRYFPSEVYRMDCGLTIYQSVFQNASGGYGVVGGIHAVFTEIENWHSLEASNFISSRLQNFSNGYQVNPDVQLLGYKSTYSDEISIEDDDISLYKTSTPGWVKRHKEAQDVGSEIDYRCVDCRECQKCKNCEELMSIKEEVEQEMKKQQKQLFYSNQILYSKE